jgi:hypothetical protein
MVSDKMEDPVLSDLLRGVGQISVFLGLSHRQTYYKLEKGIIPAGKDGRQWVVSPKVLSAHYAKLTAGES